MPQLQVRRPRWFWVPARVLLVTLLVTLLAFAVSLFLGIFGLMAGAWLRGVHPDLRVAYRYVAFPLAGTVAVIVLVSVIVMEVRHYRRAKALAGIERVS